MNIMGFRVSECAGLPPGTMMACSLNDDGKLHIAVRFDGGEIRERSFSAKEMSELIDRATILFWDKLRGS